MANAPVVSDAAVQQVIDRILAAAPGAEVLLFGSRARLEARADSDVDLLVIEPVVQSRREEVVRLSDVVRHLGIPVDIIVVSRRTYEDWADTPGTVIYEAAREGKRFRSVA
ncbi:MAG: nucleotidyltransferase domain-containing protein [Candidatus Latescibacterota bacterium]